MAKRVRLQPLPFSDEELSPNQLLTRHHYLGPIGRGDVYRDEFGLMVFANPSSRRLPQDRWLELVRLVSASPRELRHGIAAVARGVRLDRQSLP